MSADELFFDGHGCLTGDCPHEKIKDCLLAAASDGAAQERERQMLGDGRAFLAGELHERARTEPVIKAAMNLKWCGNGTGSYCVADKDSAALMRAVAEYNRTREVQDAP